jgi:hypothetical protein
MFPLFNLKGALRVWQQNYCDADYARCVRYVRHRHGDQVPPNLLPNGKLLSIDIAKSRRK